MFLGVFNQVGDSTVITAPGDPWVEDGDLSLDNLKSPDLWKAARSPDLDPANTIIDFDFLTAVRLRAVNPGWHTFSQNAEVRYLIGSTLGGDEFGDTGWQSVWRLPFNMTTLTWESMLVYSGVIPQRPRSDFYQAPTLFADWLEARYVRMMIKDEDNPDGYVQLARPWIGSGIVTKYGAATGLQRGVKDFSENVALNGGGKQAVEGRRIPWVRFALPLLDNDESALIYDILRTHGTIGEVLYLPNTFSQVDAQRYGIYGTLAETSPITWDSYSGRSTSLYIEGL